MLMPSMVTVALIWKGKRPEPKRLSPAGITVVSRVLKLTLLTVEVRYTKA